MSHISAPEVGEFETGAPSVETAQTEVTAALRQETSVTGNDAYAVLAETSMQQIAARYGDDWYTLHGQGD